MRPVPSALAGPVRAAFIRPSGWADLCEALGRRRTLLLAGPAGSGRSATALRLLWHVATPPDAPVYDLDQDTDLSLVPDLLDSGRLPSGAGYVLRGPSPAAPPGGALLTELDAALHRANAHLVLILDPLATSAVRPAVTPTGRPAGRRAQDHREQGQREPSDRELNDREPSDREQGQRDVDDHAPAWTPPDAMDVLRSHLRWRIGAVLADQACNRAATAEVLTELLGAGPALQRAHDLALVVSQHVDKGLPDVVRIRERMARLADDEFDIWFDGLGDVGSRSFALAVAVLNGLPHEHVGDATIALLKKLDPFQQYLFTSPVASCPPGGYPMGRDPFQVTRRERLGVLRARIRSDPIRHDFGRVPARVVEYVDPAHPRRVIERMWREYDVQDIILSWLDRLVESPSEKVRVWAATTAGILASASFGYVLDTVLLRWSASTNDRTRDAAAYALSVPAMDPEMRPVVLRVVNRWYADRTSPLRQATAARAHGVALGRYTPAESIAALDRLAQVDHARIAKAIGDSLADLLLIEEAWLAPTILATLLRWVDDRNRQVVGQFAFLVLANVLLSDVGTGDQIESWPTLLHLAEQRPDLRRPLATLWRRVLAAAPFPAACEKVMRNWAGYAEKYDDVRESFARMVRATPDGDDRVRAVLLRNAALWRDTENLQPLPRSAAAIEFALNGPKGF